MFLLQNAGVSTARYQSDSAIPLDEVGEQVQAGDISDNEPRFEDLDEFLECTEPDGDPLLFAFDCEATGGSFYVDHIIEMAAVVIAPDNVIVTETSFSQLCKASRPNCACGNNKWYLFSLLTAKTLSKINNLSLLSERSVDLVFQSFCTGLKPALRKSMNHPRRHFIHIFCLDVSHCNFITTVLVAQNGFTYDF